MKNVEMKLEGDILTIKVDVAKGLDRQHRVNHYHW